MSLYDFSGSDSSPTDSSRAMSRRQFLSAAARTLGSASLLGSLGYMGQAEAASTSGYRALVYLYLSGGNNGFNTVVPNSTAGHATYANSRGGLAISRSSLLSLNGTASDGQAYGLHASCPEMRSLFNSGKLAVLNNVGTLVRPVTATQARSGLVPLPSHLFSHLDQEVQWYTSIADGLGRQGWAGRIADLYQRQGHRPGLAMNIAVAGSNYWQDGASSVPYIIGNDGAPVLNNFFYGSNYRNGRRREAMVNLINQASADPSLLMREYAGIQNSAIEKVSVVTNAQNAAGSLTTSFPGYLGDSGLGGQLAQVARCIKAHNQLGDSRQIFYVVLTGFDTHNGELDRQRDLLRILSQNLQTFWTAMNEIGEQNNVTLFTGSDFGRGLRSNGDGSDHAWGNHQFVLGGAVRGGQYYGRMPSLVLDGADDIGSGRIIPTTSTDQYAATLANWFGVAASELPGLFPNLPNFPTQNLGFMA